MVEALFARVQKYRLDLAALVSGIGALVLGSIPFASFGAWIPAEAAIVLGAVALTKRIGRMWMSIAALALGFVAFVTAVTVSFATIVLAVGGTLPGAPEASEVTPSSSTTQRPPGSLPRTPAPTQSTSTSVDVAPLDAAEVTTPSGQPGAPVTAMSAGVLAADLL